MLLTRKCELLISLMSMEDIEFARGCPSSTRVRVEAMGAVSCYGQDEPRGKEGGP